VTDFQLSPGITPVVVDLAVVLLPLGVAAGYSLGGRRGVEVAIGLVTMTLGAVKLYTDWNDAYDLPLALGGLTVGWTVVGVALERREIGWMPGPVWRGFGALAIVIGLYKIWGDFYDPFDIQLGALVAGMGLWVLLANGAFSRFRGVPAAGS
jgi:hypothetical protein